METGQHKPVIYVVAVAAALAIVGLAYQHFEIRSLRLQLQEHQATIESASGNAAAALARLEALESRLERPEHAASATATNTGYPPAEKLDALQPGYYRLTTSTRYRPGVTATYPYTITHVVVELDHETYRTKLNVGLAITGMTPSGVYFDYDNDGEVDQDMALDFISEIPVFGRSLARTYGPVTAQHLYSVFVNEAENAEFTSVDDLANDAEAASSYVWRFVNNHYSAIEAWLLENLPDQQKES